MNPRELPREDGAWYMALTCWAAGLVAVRPFAWEPLAVAPAIVAVFVAAQAARNAQRLRGVEPGAARRSAIAALMALLPAAGIFAWLAHRAPDPAWLAALALPAVAYAPILLGRVERHPAARLLAIGAFCSIAPATYALGAGRFGVVAGMLWGAFAGYYLLGGLFVMARLRRSAAALAAVRVLSVAALAGSFACSSRNLAQGLLAAAFALLALRAWAYRPAAGAVSPRRIGRTELAYSSLSALLIIAAILLR